MYIYEESDWPDFHWNSERIARPLAHVRHLQGRLIGHMQAIGFNLSQEAELQTLTSDVLKSSEIEGEKFDPQQVRSSVARRLGIDIGGLEPKHRLIEGTVEMVLDVSHHYDQPLTTERLFSWHSALFPEGRSGFRKILSGAWRNDSTGPMQVVSGPLGRERIHFQAPSAELLPKEIDLFLKWFNATDDIDAVLKSAVAHFWFVTIHPFDDGNGRIARAIADMQLARSEMSARRFYSMSAQIQRERNDYYEILEKSQKGGLDITAWIEWFLGCLTRAVGNAEAVLGVVMAKARFWQRMQNININERQRLVINRFLDGFEGNLTTSKYAKLAKCSPDTALRDIASLMEAGVFIRNPGKGRSTSYSISNSFLD